MKGRCRGNFVVISGIFVAALVAAISFWGFSAYTAPTELKKPEIVTSTGKPLILGEMPLAEAVSSDLVQTVGQNRAIADTSQPEKPAVVPPTIATSGEKGLWIFVDKANFRLYLANKNQIVDSWGIATGKNAGNKKAEGDCRTPEGVFSISRFHDSSAWSHDFKDGKGVINGAYGPWFIRLKTPGWQGIGIHGTHDPDSIGTRATEGCIRLKNEDLVHLKSLVKVGMKVVIGPDIDEEKKNH
ncbi:MAG: L,D-transpeptidase [Pyramidobacter sp.]